MAQGRNDSDLSDYRDKRNFSSTDEPDGSSARSGSDKPIFVIQEHDATNLHYDFRLEIDGTLKSWSVPKGPSTDPRVRRLAIQTEDHPLDYADFEGMIPEGEYGGGAALVWDTGPFDNLREEKSDDGTGMAEAWDEGKIEVRLHGEKLHGGYAIIRTGAKSEGKWLLIKMQDDDADARRNPVSTEPESVKSGKTIEEIEEESNDD